MGVQERRAREKENLRQEILDAARALIAKEGYESVSIRKIADRIEYSPGSIYLYFHDKREILEQICIETFARLDRKMEAIAGDHGNPIEALRRGLRLYALFGLENPDHYVITFMQRNHEAISPDHGQPGLHSFECLRNVVQSAVDAGLTRSQDTEAMAQSLWAGVHGVVSLLIAKCGFPFIEQNRLIDSVVDILVEGIRKP